MRKQAGFTLIELITVVVILGVLAAFALPRFAGLEGNAREAAVNGLAGSLRSGAALAHAQWLATGSSPSTITMEGQSITMDSSGYPAAATGGIDQVLQSMNGYTAVPPSGGGTTFTFTLDGAPTPASCSVDYVLGTGGAAPTVTVTVSGC